MLLFFKKRISILIKLHLKIPNHMSFPKYNVVIVLKGNILVKLMSFAISIFPLVSYYVRLHLLHYALNHLSQLLHQGEALSDIFTSFIIEGHYPAFNTIDTLISIWFSIPNFSLNTVPIFSILSNDNSIISYFSD